MSLRKGSNDCYFLSMNPRVATYPHLVTARQSPRKVPVTVFLLFSLELGRKSYRLEGALRRWWLAATRIRAAGAHTHTLSKFSHGSSLLITHFTVLYMYTCIVGRESTLTASWVVDSAAAVHEAGAIAYMYMYGDCASATVGAA